MQEPAIAEPLLLDWKNGKKSHGEVRKALERAVWPRYGVGLWSEPWSDFYANLARAVQPYAHYTPELQTRAAELQLDNIVFKPYQPLELLPQSLAAADSHLVILRPDMEGCIVPSKFYGAAASGRPVIFLGSPDGEVARILARSDAGLSIPLGDSTGLARAILRLRDDPQWRYCLGANARRLCTTTYTRDNSLLQWSRLL